MRCDLPGCEPEVGCHEGHPDLAECKNFKSSAQDEAKNDNLPEDTVRMPWTGRTLGRRDIAFVAAVKKPTIVALLGPHDAGKTTLLAAVFLAVAEGLKPANKFNFAGSFSLSGWQDISARMQLNSDGTAQFPAHTPDSPDRIPGLLHLRYYRELDRHELLFADAPGEWFTRWAREPEGEGAQGAKWIVSRARRHLVIADSAALAGQSQGLARERFIRIVGRLADIALLGDVALVWTKSDIEVAKEVRQRIESVFNQHFADGPIFRTQIPLKQEEIGSGDRQSLRKILEWLLERPSRASLQNSRYDDSDDPFLSLRNCR